VQFLVADDELNVSDEVTHERLWHQLRLNPQITTNNFAFIPEKFPYRSKRLGLWVSMQREGTALVVQIQLASLSLYALNISLPMETTDVI
jgi:hypothetical protein